MEARRIFIFAGTIIAVLGGMIFFTAQFQKKENQPEDRLVVSVSTFSLWEAARAVAGNAIDVRAVVPLGNDPHMFSPNPTQVVEISKSTLLIYNGAGFEAWVESLKETLPKSTRILDMSQHVALHKSDQCKEDGHDEHEHEHGAYDPHYWLDIDNMIKMTKTIDEEFSALMPTKAGQFHKNAQDYSAQLQQLKKEFTEGLAECKKRTLVSNHDAFGYLAHANKLENISVLGLSSDEQPSAQTVAHTVEVVKKHGIKTIFFEEFINDNVSQTIARETGAKAIPLQPLENISQDELKSHQTYLTIMRENLTKLKTAMECH